MNEAIWAILKSFYLFIYFFLQEGFTQKKGKKSTKFIKRIKSTKSTKRKQVTLLPLNVFYAYKNAVNFIFVSSYALYTSGVCEIIL